VTPLGSYTYTPDISQIDLSVSRFEGAKDHAIFHCVAFPAPCGLLLLAARANGTRGRPAPLAAGAGAAHCVPCLQCFEAVRLFCKRRHLIQIELGQSLGPFLKTHFPEFIQKTLRLVGYIISAYEAATAIQSAMDDIIRTRHRHQTPSSI